MEWVWESQLLMDPPERILQKRSSRGPQDCPPCPTEAPVPHRTTKILSLQAILFKPVLLNMKRPSLSLKLQPRNDGNEAPFPRCYSGFSREEQDRNLSGVAENPAGDTGTALKLLLPTLSQGSLPPNPTFVCVWPFWGDDPLVSRLSTKVAQSLMGFRNYS